MHRSENVAVESAQAILLIKNISVALKAQHRNFDDAVVNHCLELIADYVEQVQAKRVPHPG